MALQRTYLKKVMLSLFSKEASYDAGPGGWAASQACSMLDFPDGAGYEEWDDTIQVDTDVVTGKEFISKQEIARQSVRLTYEEPRVKPNTLAGLGGLVLGSVTSVQDGTLAAYRHKLVQAGSTAIASIGLQTIRDAGVQRKYTGVKGEGFTLRNNGAYLTYSVPMIGSGTRATASDAFAASISESWLLWGNAKIFLKDVSGGVISIPATPVQGSANMGGSETNFSTRVLTLELGFTNNLQPDQGYRASTGRVRTNFHPSRRTAMLRLGFETDTATESTELNNYLNQTPQGFELNIDSGTVIAATGTFKYGAIYIIPKGQLRLLRRAASPSAFELLEYEVDVLDDATNPQMVGWVYTAQPAYLA